MLQVSNIAKSYGGDQILDRVSFVVNPGERVGLIGPNGCGKTTLLRIIMGQETPDQGSARLSPPGARVGYLAQALEYAPDDTVGQAMWQARGPLDQARQRMQALAAAMSSAQGEALERALADYGEALAAYEALGGYEMGHRIDAILDGLGLAQVDQETPVAILSGGQKTRLGLARLLLAEPHLLLLDEPTNHLDMDALEWLEGFLRSYAGAVVVVSHDRTFLNNTVTRILELDPVTHTVTEYPGDYTAYAAAKERELKVQWQTYGDQQDRIAQYERSIRGLRGQAMNIENTTVHFYWRKQALKIARRAVTQARRLQRLLESEDRVDKPKPTWTMKLAFADTPAAGQEVLALEELGMAFGEHVLFQGVNQLLRQGERIALLGPNGSGKTTLLRLVTGELEPTSGRARLGANVRLGYYSQEQEHLDDDSTPLEEIQRLGSLGETEARSFLHYFLFAGDDVFVPVGELSYGERARLALAKLVARGCNLLLLDEPINHLDIPSRENFERAMSEYEGTVLMVAHDRTFVERLATGIWALGDQTIRRYVDLEDMRRGRARRPTTEE
ncbi:MAG: ABC-F type ribosomal protection protein [Chloroflexi bacterium]|nr:ABC-F type ribosomal protection protein [Chloroflexota bacterium]